MHIHHPSVETLTNYASGALKLSHALGVSTHIEFCPECKAQVRKLENIGAELFSLPVSKTAEDTEALKSAVFDRIFSESNLDSGTMIQQLDPIHVKPKPNKAPKSLAQFISSSYDELKWSRVSPSIKIATLCNDVDGTQISISHVKAGGKMPHHTHTGQEITVVLEGSFSDEGGIYSPGDFMLRDASDKHTPVVSKDAPCICLMVLDSPIQFTGLITRLLNPIIRKNHYNNL